VSQGARSRRKGRRDSGGIVTGDHEMVENLKQCQGEIKGESCPSDQVIQIINTTMGIAVSCDQSSKRVRATHPTLPLMPTSNTM
jgi:hypothetical protein